MLLYQKIDISEGIDINKANASKECEVCHYCFFKNTRFKFQEPVSNKCHDLLTIAYSLKDIAILNAKGATSRCVLMGISKNEGLLILNFRHHDEVNVNKYGVKCGTSLRSWENKG